jgi:hypothetical protein
LLKGNARGFSDTAIIAEASEARGKGKPVVFLVRGILQYRVQTPRCMAKQGYPEIAGRVRGSLRPRVETGPRGMYRRESSLQQDQTFVGCPKRLNKDLIQGDGS